MSIDRFGKPFTGHVKKKSDLYDVEFNNDQVALREIVDDLYRMQPLRSGCKLCNSAFSAPLMNRNGINYYICESCGHLNGAHKDTPDFCSLLYVHQGRYSRKKALYIDSGRAEYNHRVADIYRPKANFLIEELEACGERPASLRYADFGAGSGHLVAALLGAGLENVAGYDVSESQVAHGNEMIGRQLLHLHSLEQTLDIVRSAEIDVACSIFALEHMEDPVGFCRAIAENRNIKYVLMAVPLFSPTAILDSLFPSVMPRILGLGHTHLFTKRSYDWLLRSCRFEPVRHWWFGGDAYDIHRAISIMLRKTDGLVGLVEEWDKMFDNAALDAIQMAFDRSRYSSEVHSVLKIVR